MNMNVECRIRRSYFVIRTSCDHLVTALQFFIQQLGHESFTTAGSVIGCLLQAGQGQSAELMSENELAHVPGAEQDGDAISLRCPLGQEEQRRDTDAASDQDDMTPGRLWRGKPERTQQVPLVSGRRLGEQLGTDPDGAKHQSYAVMDLWDTTLSPGTRPGSKAPGLRLEA